MIIINIALIILGILYAVGSVTNFSEWYYRHDYLAIALSVFTSILLLLAGVLNILNQEEKLMIKHYITKYESNGKRLATSWIQLNLFGKAFCFNEKTIDL